MKTKESYEVTIEGFVDYVDTGYVYVCKPVVQEHVDSTNPDEAVEQIGIDLSMGEELWKEEAESATRIRKAFYKIRKKNTEMREYFKRVIKVYPDDDEKVFEVIESAGLV